MKKSFFMAAMILLVSANAMALDQAKWEKKFKDAFRNNPNPNLTGLSAGAGGEREAFGLCIARDAYREMPNGIKQQVLDGILTIQQAGEKTKNGQTTGTIWQTEIQSQCWGYYKGTETEDLDGNPISQ